MKKRGAVKLGSISGIEVELHFTWFLILVLLVWGLSTGFFPVYYPEMSAAVSWLLGSISAVLLFASVFVHELSHSIVAIKNKMKVKKITLFFFGGIAHIPGERLTPKKEFTMAIAGPIVSFAIGVLFFIIYKVDANLYLTAISSYLWRINFIIAGFNMVPGFPLDGGRVFRAILWHIYKDVKKATRVAASGGKVFAVMLIAFGFIGMIFGGYGGLWFILIGFFLFYIAGASYKQIILKEMLSKIKVSEVMIKKGLKEDTSVREALSKILKTRQESFAVEKDNRITGMVSIEDIKKVPEESISNTKVKDIMKKPVNAISSDESALKAMMKMLQHKTAVLPVKEEGEIKGIVARSDIIRYIRIKS